MPETSIPSQLYISGPGRFTFFVHELIIHHQQWILIQMFFALYIKGNFIRKGICQKCYYLLQVTSNQFMKRKFETSHLVGRILIFFLNHGYKITISAWFYHWNALHCFLNRINNEFLLFFHVNKVIQDLSKAFWQKVSLIILSYADSSFHQNYI